VRERRFEYVSAAARELESAHEYKLRLASAETDNGKEIKLPIGYGRVEENT
ncbi:hypothetical protein TI39_contig5813g00001, partial [Zymoseptoria brevis]